MRYYNLGKKKAKLVKLKEDHVKQFQILKYELKLIQDRQNKVVEDIAQFNDLEVQDFQKMMKTHSFLLDSIYSGSEPKDEREITAREYNKLKSIV